MDKGLIEEFSYYVNPNQFLGPDISFKDALMGPFNKIWPGGGQPPGTAFNSWWDRAIGSPAPAPGSALGV